MLTNSIIDDIKYHFRYGDTVLKLIFINVGVFLAFGIFYLISYFAQSYGWYQLAYSKVELYASIPILLHQPWAIVTYMFMHANIMHILFNMLWLYWFGQIFTLYLGDKKVLPLYFIGGLTGALFFILSYNLIPVFKPDLPGANMVGASAAIMAIVFAAASVNPDHEIRLMFIGNVRIKYIAVFSLLLDIINIPYGNAGGYIAHCGGALSGYLYIKGLHSGFDAAKVFTSPFSAITSLFLGRPKMKATYKAKKDTPSSSTETRNSDEQKKVDTILDKISRSGYDSLTKEEKDFLFHYSRK